MWGSASRGPPREPHVGGARCGWKGICLEHLPGRFSTVTRHLLAVLLGALNALRPTLAPKLPLNV